MTLEPMYAISFKLRGGVGQRPLAIYQIEVDGKSYHRPSRPYE